MGPLDIWDELVSINTNPDRGYTAAEERYGCTLHRPAERNAADVLDGVGTLFHAIPAPIRPLNDLIRESFQHYGNNRNLGQKKWLPYDKLFEFVNETQVYYELQKAFEEHPSHATSVDDSTRRSNPAIWLKAYAEKICGHVTYEDDGRELKSSCRSIFAILALTNKVIDAVDFVDAGLSDRDLPLNCRPSQQGPEFYSVRHQDRSWRVGRNWEEWRRDLFIGYQKLFLSPFFDLDGMEVQFHDLDDDVVLPFVEDFSKSRKRQGGHGTVWRVEIHEAHHNAHKVVLSGSFATFL